MYSPNYYSRAYYRAYHPKRKRLKPAIIKFIAALASVFMTIMKRIRVLRPAIIKFIAALASVFMTIMIIYKGVF